MAGRLSFSIAINLLTENFKRGSNQVKAAFRSMQMQLLTFAAALGAGGLGLSNFVSRLIEVARETNRVTTALKNVSGTMSRYADNQRYLLDLAKKYGLEINALTANYAKFTAAASISGMSMMNQRKVFESVSRACTAFGMSADDSNGVMLALSQMMSKGKISSEELRLQMGERLPVALQAMAKAAGVSVGGLDKLMKQGKLMSADVLPKFAEALNEMIPNVDTDNLETSVNRLKNAFTEFVNGTDAQSKYKALIDWLTGAVQGLGDNLKNIMLLAFAAIVFAAINAATKMWRGWSVAYDNVAMSGERASARAIAATEKRVLAEQTLAVKRKAEALAEANYQTALANGVASDVITAEVAKDKAIRTRISAESALEKARTIEQKALDKEKSISTTTSAMAGANGFKKACIIVGGQAKRLMLSLKGLWNSFAPAIIFSALAAIGGKLFEMYQQAKRIKNIFSDYQKSLWSASTTPEITRMQTLINIMNDRKKSQNEINTAQGELQKMLGKENLSQEELNKLVKTRIALLREAAMAEHAFNTVGEYSEKNAQLSGSVGLSTEQMDRLVKLKPIDGTSNQNSFAYNNAIRDELKKNGNLYKGISLSDVDKAVKEYIENNRVIADATNRAGKYQANASTLTTSTVDPDDDKKKKTPLQKEQESFDKQFEELGAELEIGKITQAEYNKNLGELNIKMYAQAKGTGNKEVLESEYLKARKQAAEKAIKDQDKNTALVEFEKVQKDYNTKVEEARTQQAKGLMSQKDLNSNIASLSIEAAKSVTGIKGIGDEADVFITAMQLNAKLLSSSTKVKPRDTTFDYKKTKVDIKSEELDKAKELADKYKEEARVIGKTLSDEVANAMANVPSLEEALKLAQVQEDIKNLNKELNESLYSGVKDIASSSDRIVSAFSNLRDVMNDVDATGWERIMAIWNAMTNVVDAFLSIIKMIENLTKITDKLTKAKETEAAIDTVVTGTKVANAATETTAELTALGTQTTAEVSASTLKSTAASVEMAAKSTAAYAAIPFAGVGLAAAQIAAMEAMIAAAAIPKFATGGIITGGPTSGDKILARVNAGEMILNQGQQSRLFEAINSGNLGGGGNMSSTVTTRVRAKDLILTINNELKSQGKKPIS
ncbi:tape measure domain-containing protein [Bacteroides ovatus]|uniref:Tape measure domain-containing protein n=2 Tax=Bacteroides ovatus TaxID=28116 RepID=A0A1G6G5E1_BACOV|nr:tape measure domain-containing protein [Bacteroides ovatus]